MSISHAQRIRPEGLRWGVQYEMAGRGGLFPNKRIEPSSVEGFLQALRTQNARELEKMIEEGKSQAGRNDAARPPNMRQPPGLAQPIKWNVVAVWFAKRVRTVRYLLMERRQSSPLRSSIAPQVAPPCIEVGGQTHLAQSEQKSLLNHNGRSFQRLQKWRGGKI